MINLVKVLTGKDKNKSGEIIEIINSLNKAKVKGINIVKKHLKPTKEKKGGIISKENFKILFKWYRYDNWTKTSCYKI